MSFDFKKIVDSSGPYLLDSDGAWWFCYGDDDPVKVKSPGNHAARIICTFMLFSVIGAIGVIEVVS